MLEAQEGILSAGNQDGQRYNEVIVSTRVWDDGLPDLIDGFISGNDMGLATSVHRAFREAYPARKVPLVSYNPSSGFELLAV